MAYQVEIKIQCADRISASTVLFCVSFIRRELRKHLENEFISRAKQSMAVSVENIQD